MMVKQQCAYCSFVGHGYELAVHRDMKHTVHINVEVERVTDKMMLLRINEVTVAVPYVKPPEEMIAIKIAGQSRFPIEEGK